jgi:phosphoribosylanthranilate isomerase
MKAIVKICGLSSEETVEAAIAAGADMVGFVLFTRSPRYVGVNRAAELARRARGRAETVAVAVNMDAREIDEVVRTMRPDWIQLHGTESADQVAAVGSLGVKVMKALPIAASADLDDVPRYAAVCDRLIFDARPPKNADRPGGHGLAFDWSIVSGLRAGVPWLISGGLDAGNVARALAVSGANGVDVSSGVETSPGRKDPMLIAAFVAAVRVASAAVRERVASRPSSSRTPSAQARTSVASSGSMVAVSLPKR